MANPLITIEGFKCYAPLFLEDTTHFPRENYEALYSLEKEHFWFESRNRIINYFIRKHLDTGKACTVLEVGCGTGFVLESIAATYPYFTLEGTEIYLEGLKFASRRLPFINFFQSDARVLPFVDKYDAVCAFDVIEHIEEDLETLKSIHKSLKPGGYIFLTVPQHMWLWSKQDEFACHKRRYIRKQLKNKLSQAGFMLHSITSFVFTLLPLMLLSRLKNSDPSEMNEFKISKPLNTFLSFGMKFDELLIKNNISLPLGGSLLAVAQK